MHSTFVSDIKIYNANPTVHTQIIDRATDIGDSVIIDTKLQDFFEKAREAQENSSKVVDKNGEPLAQAIAEYIGTFDPMNSDIMFRIIG